MSSNKFVECDALIKIKGRVFSHSTSNRRIPGRILPDQDSLDLGFGAVSHRQGWGGGLVPFITTAAYTATDSLGYALIYPIAVPAICFVLSLFLMPETRETAAQKAQAASPRHNGTDSIQNLD